MTITYLVFTQHLLCESIPTSVGEAHDSTLNTRFFLMPDTFMQHERVILHFVVGGLPQVHHMIFVVSPVEVDVIRVDEQERKQDNKDFDGVFASVYKVPVKHVGLLQGRHAVL